MGDACNMADIERFMRSKTGKKQLKEIERMLKGHTIVDVTFTNEVWTIAGNPTSTTAELRHVQPRSSGRATRRVRRRHQKSISKTTRPARKG